MSSSRTLFYLPAALAVAFTLFAQPATAGDEGAPFQSFDISLAELLDDEGRIQLREGFSGSIDPAGFEMVSGVDGAPRFVQAGVATNDQWSEGEFGVPGCSGDIYAMATIDGELFIGGFFQSCGFAAASNVARLDPVTEEFSALGDGVDNPVHALAAIGTDLYVGGLFDRAGGAAARLIAKYDTTQVGNEGWSALGDGVNRIVWALVAIGTDLYVGGEFFQAGGAAANRIAKYDTTQAGNAGWSALGDGVDRSVRALAAIGTDLYVAGNFTQAGVVAASRIAKYDTTQTGNAAWSALGDGVTSTVFALAAIGTDLYVGGGFNQAGGVAANHIAAYDTTQTGNAAWSALDNGVNNTVTALAMIGTDLYVGGSFAAAGGVAATRIAKYDTTQTGNAAWSALGNGVNSSVRALAVIGTDLYVGGSLIATYDTTQAGNGAWSALGGGGVNSTVWALAAIGTDLYVGGDFTQTVGVAANRIAKYDTTQAGNAGWSALGNGVDSFVRALAAIGTDLYVGGFFTQAGGVAANRIAVYDTTQTGNAAWSALGDGVNDTVFTLAAIGTDLYVGGKFNRAGGVAANRIATYDTTQTGNTGWSALGDGVNLTVEALAAIGTDLYVGGSFTGVGGAEPPTSPRYIVRYDTTQTGNAGWSAMGDGVTNAVRALAASDTDLYVGGDFFRAGGAIANRIAKYDTTQAGNAGWSTLGDGVNGIVWALAAIGTDLYVGGQFSLAGGAGARRIAKYDTSQSGNAAWSALGDGMNRTVWALAAIGTDLYAGGNFTQAGGKVNGYFARYQTVPNQAPIAHDDAFTSFEDQVLSDDVFADNGNGADTDPDGDPIQVQSPGTFVASGIGGSVTISANGDFDYTPPPDTVGIATFDYTIADPSGATASATVTIELIAAADLNVTKTADAEFYQPGQVVTYTLTVSNPGPSDALASQVSDPLALGLESASWTCVGADGGSCPASGSGPLDAAVDLPEGASVTFTLTAVVAVDFSDDITNTASVTAPAGVQELAPADNVAQAVLRAVEVFEDRFEGE